MRPRPAKIATNGREVKFHAWTYTFLDGIPVLRAVVEYEGTGQIDYIEPAWLVFL